MHRSNILPHSIYNKPTANIIFNNGRLNVFPLKSRTIQRCPFASLLFKVVTEVLAIAIRKNKEIKYTQIRKKQKCHCFQII